MKKFASFVLAAAALGFPASAQHVHPDEGALAVSSRGSGTVNLANEGNEAAQQPFLHGLALLHNFEYGPAAAAFRRAQAADPGFALAYWGEAMTYNHPLWASQDADAARSALARLGATAAQRRSKARSEREAQWLGAVETLYGEGSKADRDLRYSERMRALHESDPSDVDARAFYALSVLGTAGAGRDSATYMRAAAILEEAYPENTEHPGVLHYLIHSYDDPVHAPLGLRAAQRYGAVAPDAGHALHMTSHIYLALGMWPESVAANVAAMAAVDRMRAGGGLPPTSCGHYPEWRAYSLLQLEQVEEAGQIVARCQAEAAQEVAAGKDRSALGSPRSLYNIWAIKLVRHGIDSGQWPAFAALPQTDGHLYGRFWLAYGRLHALASAGADLGDAYDAFARLGDQTLAAMARERPFDQQGPRWVQRALEQGRIMAKLGVDSDEGRAALRDAALVEDALPVEFGPPALPKPNWELLGDSLLRAGDKAGAADAYSRMLRQAPGRRLSVSGHRAATG